MQVDVVALAKAVQARLQELWHKRAEFTPAEQAEYNALNKLLFGAAKFK